MTKQSYDFSQCITTGRVVQRGGKFAIETPAQFILDGLSRVKVHGRRIWLAMRALRLDPGCIQMHHFLADHSKTDEQRLEHLRAAVVAGDYLWGPVLRGMEDGSELLKSCDIGDYYLALVKLGQELERQGETLEAIKSYRHALNIYEGPAVKFNLEQLEMGSTLRL